MGDGAAVGNVPVFAGFGQSRANGRKRLEVSESAERSREQQSHAASCAAAPSSAEVRRCAHERVCTRARSPHCAAVISSMPVMQYDASPSMSITTWSGSASLAPIAAGSPNLHNIYTHAHTRARTHTYAYPHPHTPTDTDTHPHIYMHTHISIPTELHCIEAAALGSGAERSVGLQVRTDPFGLWASGLTDMCARVRVPLPSYSVYTSISLSPDRQTDR